MAYQSRIRKRVCAIPRAPDGSAFQTCDDCGVSVAIVLFGMHDCKKPNKDVKRFKGDEFKGQGQNRKNQNFQDQPRSEFRLFMESFMKTCEAKNKIEADRKGFEAWKNMTRIERHPYVIQAEKINKAYTQALLKEEEEMYMHVADEADSADVGKFCENYIDFEYCDDSDDSTSSKSDSYVCKDGDIRFGNLLDVPRIGF